MRVLVIEDETALRESLKARLIESGFNVDTASDGEDGLFLALENPLDVAIVDLGLPKLPGLELIRRVRAAAKSYPILVLDRTRGEQSTVARIAMSVNLPHQFKGTHMSRFIEVLNEHRGEVTLRTLPVILKRLQSRLEAERARIEVVFPYFLEREAPVTRARALMDYACTFTGERRGSRGRRAHRRCARAQQLSPQRQTFYSFKI